MASVCKFALESDRNYVLAKRQNLLKTAGNVSTDQDKIPTNLHLRSTLTVCNTNEGNYQFEEKLLYFIQHWVGVVGL